MVPTPRTSEQLQLLADPAYRDLLETLEGARQPLHVAELAERLVRDAVTVVDSTAYEEQLEQTLVSLHHNRLPRLTEAGFVEYDPETNVVAYRDPDAIDQKGYEVEQLEELLTHLPSGDTDGEASIKVLKGRESVIEFGRQLADEAEEELFTMFVSTDLLEPECTRRARKAIDRGVAMSMGSQDPVVRELTRERLPESVIWEPQLDWLNTTGYPRVGRLVLIDRRKVMLAILKEPGPDGEYPGETAFVGEGEDHPLVVMVRELLGPRLDHLDYQSENFRTEFVA